MMDNEKEIDVDDLSSDVISITESITMIETRLSKVMTEITGDIGHLKRKLALMKKNVDRAKSLEIERIVSRNSIEEENNNFVAYRCKCGRLLNIQDDGLSETCSKCGEKYRLHVMRTVLKETGNIILAVVP